MVPWPYLLGKHPSEMKDFHLPDAPDRDVDSDAVM
jgi:hypothetical protein